MAVFATDNFNRVDGSLGGNLTDGGEAPVFEMSRTLANQSAKVLNALAYYSAVSWLV
jgi:hypothetical protein